MTETWEQRRERGLRVGVVGATGNVGRVMLAVLAERGLPIAELRAFASARSAGSTVTFPAATPLTVEVEDLATANPAGLDVALFSAGGERALEHAPRFAAAGCTVIDNSSAFRMDPDVPLVVPEVNAAALANMPRRIVANPNCSTIQLVVALAPLHREFGLRRVQVTTFQSVSGTGRDAMDELRGQASAMLAGDSVEPRVYPASIAFNVLPQCDSFLDGGDTREERKLMDESRRILGLPHLRVAATCVRVPVFISHAEAVHVEFDRPADPEEVRSLLEAAPGVRLVDDPATGAFPTPLDAAGGDDVLVGRVRADLSVPDGRGIALFVVADNLRKGAATNAVQVLEALCSPVPALAR